MIYPKIITDIDSIPSLMKQIDNWVNWRYAEDKGRLTKIPYTPSSFSSGKLRGAKADDPKTWDSFENACKNIDYRTGIGFEIGDTPLVCVDLDHVVTADGAISHKAGEIIGLFSETYKEYSPSGTGLHIWMMAELPSDHPKKKNGVELYSSGRYMTMTGKIFNEAQPIRQQYEEALSLLCEYMDYTPAPALDTAPLTPIGATDPQSETAGGSSSPSPVVDLKTDGEVMWEALNGNDGKTFAVLYYRYHTGDAVKALLDSRQCYSEQEALGNIERLLDSYNNDDSKMDWALTVIIDKYDNGNKEQTDRIFRSSDLYRDKWDQKRGSMTYGERTITGATKENAERGRSTTPSSVVETQKPQGEKVETLPPVWSYSALAMKGDYLEAVKYNPPRIRTGFPYFDQLLDGGLYPSLIVLGAKPAQGKTALGLQIMDNIARGGTDALIVSLEMSRFELIERSISFISHKLDPENAVKLHEISGSGNENSKLSKAKRSNLNTATEIFFDEYAPHLYIHESMGTMDVDKLRALLENHSNETGSSPVVMVDYIQLLQQPNTIRHGMSDKQIIDFSVTRLKQISRDFNTPVLAISSLNRATYRDPMSGDEAKVKTKNVKLESFKESGIIEYSADIVLGMNRSGNNQNPRSIELDILKNRHGEDNIAQCFDYYSGFNRFDDLNKTIRRK